jgi:hypothetical protein
MGDSKIYGLAGLEGKGWVESREVGPELGGISILDAVEAQGAGGFDEYEEVVDENGLGGRGA